MLAIVAADSFFNYGTGKFYVQPTFIAVENFLNNSAEISYRSFSQ